MIAGLLASLSVPERTERRQQKRKRRENDKIEPIDYEPIVSKICETLAKTVAQVESLLNYSYF